MSRSRTPLAVVGLACLLPGAANEDELWKLLVEGCDAIRELPAEKLDRDLYYDPIPGAHPAKTYSLLFGTVPEIELDPDLLARGDRCHAILAQVARQAWRQSGLSNSFRTGIYVGHTGGSELAGENSFVERVEGALRPFGPIFKEVARELKRSKPAKRRGLEPRQAAKRIGQALHVRGPAVVIDAACASSLVALASAALALEQGDIDCAVVAGASYAKGDSLVLFSNARSCSAHGSRPFDDSADGLVGSEGYVCLVLQRLDQAMAQGTPVRAVIRGVGLASDGRGRSLWAPRVDGQVLAMRRAYEGLDASRIEYVEAHATSTQVGDATELEALAKFFGPHLKGRKLPVGSVKSNLGHTLETAGLASLVKVVLAFERQVIPASINIEKLNTTIDWSSLPVEIVREARDWKEPGMAGVSAFGIGGLNSHVVLEPAPTGSHVTASKQSAPEPEPLALVAAGMVGAGIPNWRGRPAGSKPEGRLEDYRFDGLALRIPPRLIERGDPLGFMLLDAAGQALASAQIPREETGVLVATSFGNFFSEELQLGLRLPEITNLLHSRLSPREVETFEQAFLERYPALLDETGGFTPSSMASRVAKAYDLMGGAATLDSGPESSLDTLRLARHLLTGGHCRAVLCCGGERTHKHRTEGAVALLLKLQSVARADGDRILGILDPNAGTTPAGPFGTAQGLCDVLLSSEPARATSLVYHFGAETEQKLALSLQGGRPSGYAPSDRFRTAILAYDAATLAKRVRLAQSMADQPRSLEEQAVYQVRLKGRRPRVALCFAGQGSQSQNMLKTQFQGTAALAVADATLARLGLPSFAAMAWSDNPALDCDPVTTQLSLLVADWLMLQELEKRGWQADCVWGHSFGEFAALVAARVMTLEQALRLTRIRAEALAQDTTGGLLSVAAGPETLTDLLENTGLSITHFNSPGQTVVGGREDDLALLEVTLNKAKLPFRRLRVPGALHTELARPACQPLREALEREEFRPPDRLFVSNVGNRYTCEPEDIKANLVEQLVRPVRYRQLVERLVDDGIEVLLEVGPGRVLSSLHRQILGQTPVVLLSTDHPKRRPQEQWDRIELVFEALEPGTDRKPPKQHYVASPPEDFDATANRRERRPNKATAPVEKSSKWEAYLLDLVVDLTGYPREAIDFDWDLEADLGLDSIKQTALFGELADLTGNVNAQAMLKAEFRTLQNVLDWVSQTSEPDPEQSSPPDSRFAEGLELGRKHRDQIRRWLRELSLQARPEPVATPVADEFEKGLAQGAGVLVANLLAHRGRPFPWHASVALRHVVRMREAPLPAGAPSKPDLTGAALVVGEGEFSRQLLKSLGLEASYVRSRHDLARVAIPLPHLLLTFAAEPDAKTDLAGWAQRREVVREAYWITQEWYRRLSADGLLAHATLTAVTRLGGDFGLSGQVESAEGGALTGLLKALAVENLVSHQASIAIRAIDLGPETSLDDAVSIVLKEMSVSRHQREVGWQKGQRMVPRVAPEPLTGPAKRRPQGCWIFTGGGHGITAEVAYELGRRYDLQIHILGRTPIPEIDGQWRALWQQKDRAQLKRIVTEWAREQGREPMQTWRDAEKALRLEDTLARLAGAEYHAVDVGDGQALNRVLGRVRQEHGPIRGVVHGAGVVWDDRFALKTERWVEPTLRPKLDGTVELMKATWDDPLDYFVAFGSVSGRFGANGQTDYCLANDMMAKLVDWYRQRRPEVGAVTFHWHGWDGVGMAVRPSAQPGLELNAFNFMPVQEGVAHLLAELEAGAPEPEVVITDPQLCRAYDSQEPAYNPQDPRPMLRGATPLNGGWSLSLDCRTEPFLREHRVKGLPVLPLAFALEILAEAALSHLPEATGAGLVMEDIRAEEMLIFRTEETRSVRVLSENGQARLVPERGDANGSVERVFCSGRIRPGEPRCEELTGPLPGPWHPVDYDPRLPITHGPALRGLKACQMVGTELWGRILAPPINFLLSPKRVGGGWLVPSGLLDACFYAVGIYHYVQGAPIGLPRSLQRLELGRPPEPGEACLVRLRRRDDVFDFTAWGEDASTLLVGSGYEVGPLSQSKGGLVKVH